MKKVTESYVAGFFDGEGCITKRRLDIVNTNRNILEKISVFLTKVKIENRIEVRKIYDIRYQPAYVLRIYGYPNLIRFNEKIPLQDREKKEKLEKMLKNYKYPKITIQDKNTIRRLRKDGLSYMKIANIFKTSASTIYRHGSQ